LVALSSAFASALPWVLRLALDGLRSGAPARYIWMLAAVMIGLAIMSGVLRYLMRELLNGISRYIEYDVRNDLFQHLERLDAAYYSRMRTGDLMARLTNDLNAIRMASGPAIMYLTNTIAGGAFALAFMMHIDARLTLLALLPMLLLPVVMIRMGQRIHDRFEAAQEHFSTMTTRVQENVSGARIVRAYRQERAEEARFAAMNEEYLRRNMQLARMNGAMNPAFGLLAGLGSAVVLGLGGLLTIRGTITVGAFVAFGIYLAQLTWPMIALGWVINLFQRGEASMKRLLDILDAEPELREPESARALEGSPPGRALAFRDVWFHYPVRNGEEPRWVLQGISFDVPAGATLGIVGATGSGKSALMELIPRLHDAQRGDVLVDGVPVRELALSDLRREIGFVPQESLLFSDTIGANLRYGDVADAPFSVPAGAIAEDGMPMSEIGESERDAARWAARVAQLDETIESFPGGYDTMLGERGINLSGGQKQRAALARALARQPRIVLLDDALSAVDTHTEAEILRGLRDALIGRTAVIASHRVSAIRDASWIIVLEEGRVVEQGRHADLVALNGRYQALLRRQQLVDSIEGVEEDALSSNGPSGDEELAAGSTGGSLNA
jgi:ATP-binding cassette subfamily B protein